MFGSAGGQPSLVLVMGLPCVLARPLETLSTAYVADGVNRYQAISGPTGAQGAMKTYIRPDLPSTSHLCIESAYNIAAIFGLATATNAKKNKSGSQFQPASSIGSKYTLTCHD